MTKCRPTTPPPRPPSALMLLRPVATYKGRPPVLGVTIPVAIRDTLGWVNGNQLMLTIKGETLVLGLVE